MRKEQDLKLLLLGFELIFSNSGFCFRQIQVIICIDLIHVLSVVCVVGVTSEGKEVYLRDIWPSREEVQQTEEDTIISSIFKDLRRRTEVRAPSHLSFCVV